MPSYANVTMDNVGLYQDLPLSITGTLLPTANIFGNLGEGINVGVGYSYIARSHVFPSIMGTVTDQNGNATGAGKGIIGDLIDMQVGGATHNAVAVARSDNIRFNTVSANCTNPNTVAYQGSAFCLVNGACSGGNMTMFGLASYTAGGPKAINYNICGLEIDVGTTNNSATGIARNGITLGSMGSSKGPAGYDCAINIAGLPQYSGVQTPNAAGWRTGIQFTNVFAAVGFGEPIASTGSLLSTVGSWTIQDAFDVSTVTVTRSLLRGKSTIINEQSMYLGAVNHGIELGSLATANTPFVDAHSSGNSGNDYDFRLIFSGGTSANGHGALTMVGFSAQLPSLVGFGKAAVGPGSLPAAGSTLASLQTAVTALRDTLVNNGLGIAI